MEFLVTKNLKVNINTFNVATCFIIETYAKFGRLHISLYYQVYPLHPGRIHDPCLQHQDTRPRINHY